MLAVVTLNWQHIKNQTSQLIQCFICVVIKSSCLTRKIQNHTDCTAKN